MSKIFETIECCRICSANDLQEVLNLGDQPPANSLYKIEEDRPPKAPLRLMHCKNCSTVQLGENVDPEYLFGEYLWVTGTSLAAKQYSHEFSKKALTQLEHNNKNPYVIEVASNDGTFLRRFLESDCKVLGIDPDKSRCDLAVSLNIKSLLIGSTKTS